MAEAEIVPNPDNNNRSIARRESPPATQLATLANAFQSTDLRGVLANVVSTGDANTLKIGAVLANNKLLNQVLSETTAYRHSADSITPESDFNLLSTGSSDQAADALRRLTFSFVEARAGLAGQYDSSKPEVCAAFQTVNASYALVVSTVHQLFDRDDTSYREKLRPGFLELLGHDPHLMELTESFQDLLGAHSSNAEKTALKTFFETFCENAVEPYIYNEDFSAMVQSILLRELRHVIMEEAKLPVQERKLAPYLAGLFEKGMRAELESARNHDGKEQPVLESLRKCPGESKHLMRAVENFLRESLGEDGEGLTLPHEDVISCEVMLSIGCLLPETGLTMRLGKRLHQVDDLNPSLALVFSSALKFSTYTDPVDPEPDRIWVEPDFLVQLGMKNADRLSEGEQERLISEVFVPFADSVTSVACRSPEEWNALPAQFRADCIDKVVLQRVIHSEGDLQEVVLEGENRVATQAADLLIGHIEGGATLNDAGLRWLVDRGARGELAGDQTTQVITATLRNGDEAAALGVEPESYDALLARGGFETLRILSKVPGNESRLCEQLVAHSPSGDREASEMRQVFEKRLVKPLRTALADYAGAVNDRRESEAESMQAKEELDELARVGVRLAELEKQLPLLKSAAEEIGDFVAADIELRAKLAEIKDKEETLARWEQMSVRELVEKDLRGAPERLRNKTIPDLEKDASKIRARTFPIPDEVLEEEPELPTRTISIGQLQDMERSRAHCKEQLDRAGGASSAAIGRMQASIKEMDEQRSEIKMLFSLVQRAAESEAVKGVDPESLRLTRPGSFDPLGMFCRISLEVQMNADNPIEEGRESRRRLEQDVQSSLEHSFKDPMSKEDSRLVLNELAALVHKKAPILIDWEKGDSSLASYLADRLHTDIADNEIAWLTYDAGYDESMHAPMIHIFGGLATSKELNPETRGVALRSCLEGVKHWIANEKNARDIEESNRSAAPGEKRSVPERFVTSQDLYEPWTTILKITAGRAKGERHQNLIRAINEHLVEDALREVERADHREIDRVFIPLCKALIRCDKTESSSLHPLPDASRRFVDSVKKRVQEHQEGARKKGEELKESVPQAAEAEGIDFSKVTGPQGLALPAPPRERREEIRRIEANPED